MKGVKDGSSKESADESDDWSRFCGILQGNPINYSSGSDEGAAYGQEKGG